MNTRIAWIIMAVGLFVVGGRTLLAAQSAIGGGSTQSTKSANRKQDSLVYEATRGDSLIRSIASLRRSPFMPPPARVVAGPSVRRVEVPAPAPPVVPPRAVMLMQDGNSTMVQIEVEGETSGRMTVGSSFRGWTITGIGDQGILVTNGTSTFNLPRP